MEDIKRGLDFMKRRHIFFKKIYYIYKAIQILSSRLTCSIKIYILNKEMEASVIGYYKAVKMYSGVGEMAQQVTALL